MPVALSYPGVYVEEIPSGVRTITGVATSITAFIGRAKRGPVDEPVTVNGFGEFERIFGGLWAESPMTYAVRDFFGSGGGQAIVVRVGNGASMAKVSFEPPNDKIKLEAVHEGTWGNALRAEIQLPDSSSENEIAERYAALGLGKGDFFNLSISDGIVTEKFVNLTFKESPRRVDRVLKADSNLVRWQGKYPDGTAEKPFPSVPNGALKDSLAQAEVTYATAVAPIDVDIQRLYKELWQLQEDLAILEVAEPASPGDITSKKEAIAKKNVEIAAQQQKRKGHQGTLDAAKSAVAGSDGEPLTGEAHYLGSPDKKTGLYALEDADLFNLLCIPPGERGGDTPPAVYQAAMAYCMKRRAMLIVDPQAAWGEEPVIGPTQANRWLDELGLFGTDARNAALYFPRVDQADSMRDGQVDTFVPCGLVAGVMARTDGQRGVWKAPAGIEAGLSGVQKLQVNLTDGQNGDLNQRGINCLRNFPVIGQVVWGARTMRGADQLADEYKYVPIRRLALYIEESLYRGTQWVVFEPNDEPLWAQIRLNVGAFMRDLFRQGAFQGSSPRDAYFVKCDADTNPQIDIDRGIVNIHVGFAPLKPAEFVIIKIQQIAKQAEA